VDGKVVDCANVTVDIGKVVDNDIVAGVVNNDAAFGKS
jgi:hypothetical protein